MEETLCEYCAHEKVCQYKKELENLDMILRELSANQLNIFTMFVQCEHFQY